LTVCFKSDFYLTLKTGKVDKNPVSLVKLSKENNKRVCWLTEEEEVRSLSVLPIAYRPMVLVALHTGMRKSEQLNLEWTDVDFRRNPRPGNPGICR
jgi:integrase